MIRPYAESGFDRAWPFTFRGEVENSRLHRFGRSVGLVACVLWGGVVGATSEPVVTNATLQIARVEMAVLSAADPRPEEAREAHAAGRFAAVPANGSLPLTGGDRHLWVRIEWSNPGARTRLAALEVRDFLEDRTVFYLEQGDGTLARQQTGENVRYTDRSVWGRDPVLVFPVPAQERFVTWINNENDNSPWPLFRLHDPADQFYRVRQWRSFASGAYYGTLLVLVVFGVFVLVVLRQRDVLFYLLYVATFSVAFFLFQNFHQRALPWLGSPDVNLVVGALISWSMVALIQFSRTFLTVAQVAPRLDRVLRITAWGFGGLGLFELIYEGALLSDPDLWAATLPFYHGHLNTYGTLYIALFLVLAGAGAVLWRRGLRQARFYVIGLAAVFVCMMPALLSQLSGLTSAAEMHWIQAGSALEVLLFGLAIADKVRLMRIEKNEAVLRARFEAAERHRLQEAHEQIVRQKALLEQQADTIRAANVELAAKNQRLEELAKQKGEILGIAAHDLKNPLNALGGIAQMLHEDCRRPAGDVMPAAERAGFLTEMVRSSRRMLAIIETLLRTEAVDTGSIELDPAAYPLAALVDEAWRSLGPGVSAKQVRIAVAISAEIKVYVDWPRFIEVLENVLSNAVKFSPAGGQVWVEAVPVAAAPGARSQPAAARLTVRDSGPGFTAEDLPGLFGRYRRLSARPTGKESSTGLGLFIARRLLELQGGRIELASRPGESAVFELIVPTEPPRG